jgi:acyl-CoA synthetase (AMP-forming)/AMP-acid ligase II
MVIDLAKIAGRALLRSRLLTPPGPRALLQIVREVTRGGPNPYTLLAVAAARWPNRPAVVDDDGTVSYREVQTRTELLAGELIRHGVGPGQAVGVLCRNGSRFVEAVFASALVGVDAVLLNTDFRTEALSAALSAHKIRTVVCDNEFTDPVRDAGEDITAIDPAKRETQPQQDRRPKVAAPGRIVLLTSGTTGQPKGVPHQPKIASGLGIGASLLDRTGLRTGSRIAVPVPMFHGLGFGMVTLTIALGGTLLTRRRFDAEDVLSQASLHCADALTVVPVVLARILDVPVEVRERSPLRSLRVVICSGARLDPSLAKRFMETYGDILYNAYGSSEVGIGAVASPADLRQAPETVGRPVVGCPVRILDESDRPVGPNVTGRVFVGGELTFDAYTGGGTMDVVGNMTNTDDLGYFDESGRLFIVGRQDDMIVSGGENVYPRAVENALAEYQGLADNAVVAVPDDEYGQRLAAFVVPRPGVELDPAAIRKYLKTKVSRFEEPRDVKVVETIPRNPAGKIFRNDLPT